MVKLLLQPRSLEEVLAALAEHGEDARVIAGGTAVVLMLQNRLIDPDVLVSLASVPNLGTIAVDTSGSLSLGAQTTLREAERSPAVIQRCPALAGTYGRVANVRIRNAATVCGNLTEADYASDPPSMLIAHRAQARAVSSRGERMIELGDLFRGFYQTSLEPDELLVELRVPALPASTRAVYHKLSTRSTEDRPCLGVAALADLDEGQRCRELRVVIGAVDEVPRELPGVELLAAGQRLTDELIAEIAEGYAAGIEPLSDLRGSAWYRTEMIRVFVRRALEALREAA